MLSACGGGQSADAGALDAGGLDGSRLDAAGLDAAGLDAAGLDAAGADAARDAGPPRDGGFASDARIGAPCDLNRQCASSQRCECDALLVCTCQEGPRGTGRAGVDECADGDDCASALCVEGTDRYWCSEECVSDADCAGALPRCVPIPGFVSLCARLAPDAG
ncbi:MAG: hypothetical protein IT378_00570 [Sandaracinaceae bacterium]|nr:hypothetical protein [Sandaracinaceae bacterium]